MAGRPDLVDTTQLIDRLDLSEPGLRGLQNRGTFPPPELHFRSRPIWWWDRVEHWKRQRRRTRRKPFRLVLDPLDLVDATTAATRLGVRTRAIEGWLAEGHMIEPDYRWSHTTAWQWQTIEHWLGSARGREIRRPPEAPPVTPVEAPAPSRELDPFEEALAGLQELQESLGNNGIAESRRTGARPGLEERLRTVEEFIERVDRSGS
ncbi:MAG: hypothetical protein HKN74_03065 [Acidimicrobiia bacterium]|nr:hypothetical protein [Acidimicrobiia bacterium]